MNNPRTRWALVPVVALAATLAGALLSACGSGTSATAEGPRPATGDPAAANKVQAPGTLILRRDHSKALDPAAITRPNEGTQSVLTPKEQIAALEASGALPQLDRSASLLGPLAANGVRVDVEAHIVKNYATPEQQSAARQTAVALQNTLVVDVSDLNAVLEVNRKLSYASHCIHAKFERNGTSKHPAQVSRELESMFTNTKPRLLAYLAFSKALDGQAWSLPEGDTCE